MHLLPLIASESAIFTRRLTRRLPRLANPGDERNSRLRASRFGNSRIRANGPGGPSTSAKGLRCRTKPTTKTMARAPMPGMASNEPSQTGMLDQMRDRLASLSDEARSIRSQVPHEFEPDIERIQAQMQRLGERLHDLGRGALVPYKTAQQDSAPQRQDDPLRHRRGHPGGARVARRGHPAWCPAARSAPRTTSIPGTMPPPRRSSSFTNPKSMPRIAASPRADKPAHARAHAGRVRPHVSRPRSRRSTSRARPARRPA